MQIYPAIDIKRGKVVRLFEGDGVAEVVYAADPVAQAEQFLAAGASWIHVVDLDVAFDTGGDNTAVVKRIAALPGARLQLGGLLRTARQVHRGLEAGATRVVAATEAVANREALEAMVREAGPERLAAAVDVRAGQAVIRRSPQPLRETPEQLAATARGLGIGVVVYRDLERDGALAGLDVAGAARLVRSGTDVIVSGGGASLGDLATARAAGVAAAIVGRALYDRRFTLQEAIRCSR